MNGGANEPAAATSDQTGRLRHFGETKDSRVETSGYIFLTDGHCQLNVVETYHLHCGSLGVISA